MFSPANVLMITKLPKQIACLTIVSINKTYPWSSTSFASLVASASFSGASSLKSMNIHAFFLSEKKSIIHMQLIFDFILAHQISSKTQIFLITVLALCPGPYPTELDHCASNIMIQYHDQLQYISKFEYLSKIPPLLPKILIGSLDRDCSHCPQKVSIKAI